jgi:hypothetical protein
MFSLRGTQRRKAVNCAEKIALGNTRQWVFGRGSDASNPVLLVLAGGPRSRALSSGEPDPATPYRGIQGSHT